MVVRPARRGKVSHIPQQKTLSHEEFFVFFVFCFGFFESIRSGLGAGASVLDLLVARGAGGLAGAGIGLGRLFGLLGLLGVGFFGRLLGVGVATLVSGVVNDANLVGVAEAREDKHLLGDLLNDLERGGAVDGALGKDGLGHLAYAVP